MTKQFKLGDAIEKALATIGVTEERVQKVLPNCGCKRRKELLNRLSLWAARVVTGKTEDAKKYLDEIIGEEKVVGPEDNPADEVQPTKEEYEEYVARRDEEDRQQAAGEARSPEAPSPTPDARPGLPTP